MIQGFRRGRLQVRYAVKSRYAVRSAAVLVACGVVLAGCTGGSDPKPSGSSGSASVSPSGSTSSSGSASASPSPSVSVPEAARAHTQEGGIEFAKYYATLLSDGFTVPSSAEVSAHSLAECGGCKAMTSAIDEYVKGNYRVRDSRIEITAAQLSSVYTDNEFNADVVGREKASVIVDAAGVTIKDVPETSMYLRLLIVWTDAGWAVSDLRTVKP